MAVWPSCVRRFGCRGWFPQPAQIDATGRRTFSAASIPFHQAMDGVRAVSTVSLTQLPAHGRTSVATAEAQERVKRLGSLVTQFAGGTGGGDPLPRSGLKSSPQSRLSDTQRGIRFAMHIVEDGDVTLTGASTNTIILTGAVCDAQCGFWLDQPTFQLLVEYVEDDVGGAPTTQRIAVRCPLTNFSESAIPGAAVLPPQISCDSNSAESAGVASDAEELSSRMCAAGMAAFLGRTVLVSGRLVMEETHHAALDKIIKVPFVKLPRDSLASSVHCLADSCDRA